jgi:methylmalonyl-CoA/ethylmalonyl-CoA epimerase
MGSTAATAAAPLGLSTIGQIAITVQEVDPAIAFYRDVLGMKLLFQVPNMGFFACDGVRLMIAGAEEPGPRSNSVIYFKVPDMQQAFQSLSQRGAPFEGAPHLVARMPDHDLWMAFFRDPERNLLALMSEVPRA